MSAMKYRCELQASNTYGWNVFADANRRA